LKYVSKFIGLDVHFDGVAPNLENRNLRATSDYQSNGMNYSFPIKGDGMGCMHHYTGKFGDFIHKNIRKKLCKGNGGSYLFYRAQSYSSRDNYYICNFGSPTWI
jgi:hypothetical protein